MTRTGEKRNHSSDHLDRTWRQPEEKLDEITRKTWKIEIPLFDGENAESWVLRVEQYFELGDFSEEGKLRTVRMCYDGEALLWYRWERDRDPFTSWEQKKFRVLEQFSTSYEMTARERLMTLKQTGTVREYYRDFISLPTNAPEVPDAVLETAFMIGLKPQIRARVKLMEPRNLRKIMSVAKLVEEWVGYGDQTAEAQCDTPDLV